MTTLVACEPFITVDDVNCDCDGLESELIEEMIDQASDMIAILTGGMVAGRCTTTVRPCRSGNWCAGACGFCVPSGIRLLQHQPEITSVKIDGVEVDPDVWRVVDGNMLVRVDGKAWPSSQSWWLPDTEPDTFAVTYDHGILPFLAKEAAKGIVCDMLKEFDTGRSRSQKLPSAARSATIAGVTISLEQQAEELRRRSMFIPSLIRLLITYAPDKGTPTFVYSPELDHGWTLHEIA